MSTDTVQDTANDAVVEWLLTQWGGEPMEPHALRALYDIAPVMGDVFANGAPDEYPDGQPTHAAQVIGDLARALQWAAHDAPSDGDYMTAARIKFLLESMGKLPTMPIYGWLPDQILHTRTVLAQRHRAESLAAVEAAAHVMFRWWKCTGQEERFVHACAAADSADAVNSIVIPPQPRG